MSDEQADYRKAVSDYMAQIDHQNRVSRIEQQRQIYELRTRPAQSFYITPQERMWRSLLGGLFS